MLGWSLETNPIDDARSLGLEVQDVNTSWMSSVYTWTIAYPTNNISRRDVNVPPGYVRKQRGSRRTDPVDLGDLFAVVQAFYSLDLNGDKDVVVGGGGVFPGGLSEDRRGKGRTDTPDTGDDSGLSSTVWDWELRERDERASLFLRGEQTSANVFITKSMPRLTGLDIIGQSIACALDTILRPHETYW